MKLSFALFTSFVAAAFTASAGDITGTVTLKGTPPPEIKTGLKDNAQCGQFHKDSAGTTTHHFVVGAKGELANVVVMLKGPGLAGKSTGASAAPLIMDQKGCEYSPQIFAIQTNQKLVVKNSDPVMHNVYMIPQTEGNKAANAGKLNVGQAPGAADLTFTFTAPENFLKFQCQVHEWMFAWMTVVDHPYYAVTGPDGTFKISNVPPGKYTITALHRKAAPTGMDKEIEVAADGAKTDFTLEVK